jgi:MFS family permease
MKHRGKAFGLEGAGDNLGTFIGPLIAVVLLFLFEINIRFVFYLAVIPRLLSVMMIFLVKEKRGDVPSKSKTNPHIRNFPASYWINSPKIRVGL